MSKYNSLNHTKWVCKYHVVFTPKCRRKELYGKIGQHLYDSVGIVPSGLGSMLSINNSTVS